MTVDPSPSLGFPQSPPQTPSPKGLWRLPQAHSPQARLDTVAHLPTVWLASCFMRLNCFFMAAAAPRPPAGLPLPALRCAASSLLTAPPPSPAHRNTTPLPAPPGNPDGQAAKLLLPAGFVVWRHFLGGDSQTSLFYWLLWQWARPWANRDGAPPSSGAPPRAGRPMGSAGGRAAGWWRQRRAGEPRALYGDRRSRSAARCRPGRGRWGGPGHVRGRIRLQTVMAEGWGQRGRPVSEATACPVLAVWEQRDREGEGIGERSGLWCEREGVGCEGLLRVVAAVSSQPWPVFSLEPVCKASSAIISVANN